MNGVGRAFVLAAALLPTMSLADDDGFEPHAIVEGRLVRAELDIEPVMACPPDDSNAPDDGLDALCLHAFVNYTLVVRRSLRGAPVPTGRVRVVRVESASPASVGHWRVFVLMPFGPENRERLHADYLLQEASTERRAICTRVPPSALGLWPEDRRFEDPNQDLPCYRLARKRRDTVAP